MVEPRVVSRAVPRAALWAALTVVKRAERSVALRVSSKAE
jgi:hypothetical protein